MKSTRTRHNAAFEHPAESAAGSPEQFLRRGAPGGPFSIS